MNYRKVRLLLFFLFTALFLFPVAGGSQNNPFELVPRMEHPPADTLDGRQQGTGNPFDIIYGTAPPGRSRVLPPDATGATAGTVAAYKRLKLFIILGILLILAVLTTVMRSLVNKSLRAFLNDNVMNQLYRDQEGRGLLPFLFLYAMFLINTGVFVFLLIKYYELSLPFTNLQLLVNCIFAVSALLIAKRLVLSLIGYTFSIQAEMSRYNFTIIIFGIVTGLFLVPANLFLAYAPAELLPIITLMLLLALAAIYLFRYLRSLTIANKFFSFHLFHFFLYFCTVEIAPALFLLKLIKNQL